MATHPAKKLHEVLERRVLPRLESSNRRSIGLGLLDLGQLAPTVIRRWYFLMAENARASAVERLTFMPRGPRNANLR